MAQLGCMISPASVEPGSPNSTFEQRETVKRKVREQESAVDHLRALLDAEKTSYPICTDYLSEPGSTHTGEGGNISEAWRRKLVEWCYEVVDHFVFDREVVSYALCLLDREVSFRATNATEPIVKREFQLLAVTSLYIAIKIHGQTENVDGLKRKLRIEAFVQLSRGVFSVETIEETERQMLNDLKWRVNPPTNLRFIAFYLRLFPSWTSSGDVRSFARVKSVLYEVSRYLAELSVCISKFSFSYAASTVGFAALLCALDVVQESVPFPPEARVIFLQSVADATGILSSSPEVRSACKDLKSLCPSMFEGATLPGEFQGAELIEDSIDSPDLRGGKSSPVCVADVNNEPSPISRHKRSRHN